MKDLEEKVQRPLLEFQARVAELSVEVEEARREVPPEVEQRIQDLTAQVQRLQGEVERARVEDSGSGEQLQALINQQAAQV